ncbi:MAG: DUF4116 domain-containing protein [Candidatus Cloacimonetes bacterium]|nr:DUF4116 domain-containing protein [Candidatus Cloacimonadota bacterium]
MAKVTKEIKEIIIKSTLHEICKDGKIDDLEKEVLINLVKFLKFPKSEVNSLKKQITKEISVDTSLGTLDPDYLIWSIERKLKNLLEETSIQALLNKIKPIIFEEPQVIEAFEIHELQEKSLQDKVLQESQTPQMPWEQDKEERLRKEYEDRKKQKEEQQRIRHEKYHSGPKDLNIDASNWEDYCTSRINPESINNLQEVVFYIDQGQHKQALNYLLDYSHSFNYDLRYLLIARLYFELNEIKKAKQYLKKSQDSGLQQSIIDRENFIYQTYNQYDEDQWITILKGQLNKTDLKNDDCYNALLNDLISRGRADIANRLLESFQSNLKDYPISTQKKTQIKKYFYKDIYYGYYGPIILILQILFAFLILFVCTFNREYFFIAINDLLRSIVSGVPDQDIFLSSFHRVAPYLFLLIALAPLLYVNCKVMIAGIRNRVNSAVQVMTNYIKVTSFGKVYHLGIQNKSSTFYIYEDDTDYSYISLVRHLPFIPNFTYAYAYDELRKIYVLLPLYGIADSYFFERNHISKGKGSTAPINMFGVRFAQVASVIAQINQSYLALGPILLGSAAFFYASLNFASDVQLKSFIVMLAIYIVSIGFYFIFPRLFLWWMKIPYLSKPFSINIIKPGIVLLSVWYFAMRYVPYGISSVVPIIACSTCFYLIFVRSKYFGDTKQIVAELTSLGDSNNTDGDISEYALGLKYLNLGKSNSLIPKNVGLFYNEEYVALKRSILGLTLYYDVVKRTSKFNISIQDNNDNSIVRIGNFNYQVKSRAKDIQEKCKLANLDSGLNSTLKPSKSKIHLPGVFVCFLVFSSWQYYQFLQLHTANGESLSVDNKTYKIALEYLRSNDNKISHSLHDQDYIYKNIEDQRIVQYFQSRAMTWQELENSIRHGLDKKVQKELTVPAYIKKDGYREDVWVFMYWHSYLANKAIDNLRYGQVIKDYCHSAQMSAVAEGYNIRCAISFDYDTIIKNVLNAKEVPSFIPTTLMASLTRENGLLLEFADQKAQSNFDVVLKAVKNNGLALKYASSHLQDDKDIVLAAVQENYLASQYMAKRFWSSVPIVEKLVSKDGLLLTNAKASIKSNKKIVLKALRSNYLAYKSMDSSLLNDNEIAHHILAKDGLLLNILNKTQKRSKELVKVAVSQNGLALKYCDDRFHSDSEVVALAISSDLKASKIMDQSLWENKEVVIRIVGKNGLLLNKVPKRFKADRDVVISALGNNYRAASYMTPVLYEDAEIAKIVLQSDGMFLGKVHSKLTKDRELVKIACASNGRAFQFADPIFYKDKELISLAFKTYKKSIVRLDPSLKDDYDFFLQLMKIDLSALQASELDHEVVALKANAGNVQYQTMLAYLYEYGIGTKPDYKLAKKWYLKASDFGHLQATTQLAILHSKIKGESQTSWKYLSQAAKESYVPAMVEFAKIHDARTGTFKDDALARNYYFRANDAKSIDASFQLARYQEYGFGGAKNIKEAIKNYKNAYYNGHKYAPTYLGLARLFGQGVDKDHNKSFFYFLDGSKREDSWAMFFLALSYQHGIGTKVDQQAAKLWYKQSQQLNNPLAGVFANSNLDRSILSNASSLKHWLDKASDKNLEHPLLMKAYFYQEGLFGYNINIALAKSLYEQGSLPYSKFYLAKMKYKQKHLSSDEYRQILFDLSNSIDAAKTQYSQLIFSEKEFKSDYELAFSLLKKAAKNNYLPAMTALAISYERGLGTKANSTLALKWFKKAAYYNDVEAKFNLGIVYEFGRGVKKDLKKAKHWYQIASFANHPKAILSLIFLYENYN